MKINYLFMWLIALLFISAQVQAQNQPKEVGSKIEKVTVFINGAQVFRSAQTSLVAGETELIFRGLAPQLKKESIQVKGEGSFTILSVIHQVNFLKEQEKRKEIEALENTLESKLEEKTRAENSLSIFVKEEEMLEKNREIGGDNTGVKTSELREALDFHRQRRQELKNKQLEYQKLIRQKQEEILKIQQQLRELNSKSDLATSEVLVKVTAKSAVNAKFELAYLVEEAGWYPTYDLRVKDIESPIDLSYKANVYQNTGIDWKNIKLTLSTANPNESGIKPTLQPWFLRYNQPYQVAKSNLESQINNRTRFVGGNQVRGRVTDAETGEGLPGVSILVKGTTLGTVTDVDGNFELEGAINQTLVFRAVGLQTEEVFVRDLNVLNVALSPDTRELSEVVVTGSARGVSVQRDRAKFKADKKEAERKDIPIATEAVESAISISFEIELPYTIPSDGKTRTVEINQHALEAEYEYYAAPKIDTDAFLTAKITNWETFNLLDGEANLFFEGTFLGKTVLLPRQVEDTLSISLGRDKSIKITRKPLKDYTKKQFIGSKKTETRAWEIIVRNQKKQAINLIVEDIFPLSTNSDIEVNRKDTGGSKVNDETGILTWSLQLKPSEEKKLNFQYEVKYPKGRILYLD